MPDAVYPLSAVDSVTFSAAYTTAYLLAKSGSKPYDTAPLTTAIQRAADKWRILAAHIVKNELDQYCVQIPIAPSNEPVVKFTTSTYDISLKFTPLASSKSNISSRPPKKYFIHSSTPSDISVYAKKRHPLISVHVSHLKDVTCIGITVPHGVFDGVGRGLLLRAIDCELNGRDWTPPPLAESNILSDVLATLTPEEGEASKNFKAGWPKASFGRSFRFLAGVMYEKYWQGCEMKSVYLDGSTAKLLVKCIKEEASATGKRVSTSDILLAWFIKSALADEDATSTSPVSIASSVSLRETLSELNPLLKTYPHNAFVTSPMPPISQSKLSPMSLVDLAVMHRAHLSSVRTQGFIGAYTKYLGPVSTAVPIVPKRYSDGTNFWVMNKATIDLASIELGAELIGVWDMAIGTRKSPEVDHTVFINKFKGGYTFTCKMRKNRWEAVAKAVEKAKRGDFS